MHAGHYISRGARGLSGVFFDERNVNLQCAGCNSFKQGAAHEYREVVIEKYGENMPDELLKKHYILPDMKELAMKAMEQFYKEKYKMLVESI